MPRVTRALPQPLPALVALVALVLLAYWPGLGGGWLFDDYSAVLRRSAVHAEEISARLFTEAALDGFNHGLRRPLAMISFAIDHVFWGKDPWGYKLTSLLVHALNALLVFAVVRRLLSLAWPARGAAVAPAAVVAAIWAIHPLQVSTVHYIVQRMEMLSLTFVLLALVAYLAGRRRQAEGRRGWPWLAGCVPLVALGVLCKETAVLFPAYTLALELTVLGFGSANPAHARRWKLAYGAVVFAGACALVFWAIPRYSTPAAYSMRDFDVVDRLLTQLRVLPMYLGWIVLPQPGNYVFYYDNFAPSRGLLQPWTTLAGGVVIALLAGAALWLRRRMPLASLGVLWFFAAHAITSSVLPLELVFEHRNYFALLGIVLVAADVYFRLPDSEIPRIRPVAVGIVVVGLLGLTLIRSATWGEPLNLALALVDRNPDSPRASMDLGEQYMLRARRDPTSRFYALAEQEFERGAAVPNASPMPEQGLIVLAAGAGQPAKPQWWDQIVHKLQTRAIGPQELSMVNGLLQMRQNGMVFDDARFADTYLVLVNRMTLPPTQYYAYAEHALEFLGDETLADGLFVRAVEKSGGDAELVAAMIDAQMSAGHPRQARAMAARARELGIANVVVPPDPPPAPPLPSPSAAEPPAPTDSP